jgi:ABC-type glycerol-3-phosphate transport system permease component
VTFLFSWNAFLWPLVILQSPRNQVIQLAIAQSVAVGQLPNWGETFAGATIATVPLILLFLILQRYFVRGIALTGMKG